MLRKTQLNNLAIRVLQNCADDHDRMRISRSVLHDIHVLDFGVSAAGGLEAGLLLARMCLGGLASVDIHPASPVIDVPQIMVRTDQPLEACLLSQYAGWKIATQDYFAMGSGPIRAAAQIETLFKEFPCSEQGTACVGVLEAASLPTEAACQQIRNALPDTSSITLCVAPTASQAGNLQVVARSVETAMHKLHELHFPVTSILSGTGAAPLPPIAKNDLAGIGRTNDAILYGSTVNLWVRCDDDLLREIGPQVPSSSSESHGRQFIELFKEANHDFYALDKNLFSPAVVNFHNLQTGRSFCFGRLVPELLKTSFGM